MAEDATNAGRRAPGCRGVRPDRAGFYADGMSPMTMARRSVSHCA